MNEIEEQEGQVAHPPKARNLAELVRACEIVESELGFQVMRLTELVQAKTEEEAKYHNELKAGYQNSQFYVRTMKRYHKGRLERRGESPMADDEMVGIDDSGKAAAFFED